jgi:SAM-dependent methyltransferase
VLTNTRRSSQSQDDRRGQCDIVRRRLGAVDGTTGDETPLPLSSGTKVVDARRVVCVLCGSRGGTTLFRTPERRFGLGGDFEVVRCDRCSLVRTEPQPQVPGAFYPQDAYYSFAPAASPSRLERARIGRRYRTRQPRSIAENVLSRIYVGRLSPGLPPGQPGRLLDVGCGSGETLLSLKAAAWRGTGIEVSARAVESARAAGLDVKQGDLLEVDLSAHEFDVVRFWHSLEHTTSPLEQLRRARALLRPGGWLVVGVPNFGSLLSRLARDRWFYLDVPRHLWHFERRQLAALAVKAGFQDVRVRLNSTSTPLLGTLALRRSSRGKDGSRRLLPDNRALWLATLPLATVLDALHLGDALELTART